MERHQGFERDAPHQEHTVSSLPTIRRQRGQSIARFDIDKAFLEYYYNALS